MAIDLSRIVSGPRMKPPKVVIYGVGGIGKTTFAAGDATQGIVGAPKPIFLFTEEGQGRLGMPRFELRDKDPVIRTWTDLMGCLEALYHGGHEYETVVIDTLDGAEPLLQAHVCAKFGKSNIEDFGYGKGYVHALDEARVLLHALESLRNDKGMCVVLTAHAEAKKFEAPDSASYDRYKLKLQERFAAAVHDWTDVLLFARWKQSVVKEKEGMNQERARAVGAGERVVYTQERPAFWAKNRYGLPFELPLGWSHFVGAIVAPDGVPVSDSPQAPEAGAPSPK